jgi:LPXTG-site transpeptidase (sortase) family protein
VTNTGPTVLNGHLGLHPGTSVTGFPPGSVNGTKYIADGVALQAKNDATTAYNDLFGQLCDSDLTGQDLGGLTLTPGVYCFDSSAILTGNLVLDAQGDPNAVWVFKMGSSLTTQSGSSVTYQNSGAVPLCNVYWQVGSSATLGTGSGFIGTIIAAHDITLTTSATVAGRVLALGVSADGAVTLDSNVITPAICAAPTPTPTATDTPGDTPVDTPTPKLTKTPKTTPAVLPDTGFTPHRVTVLSAQPALKAYADLGDLWLDIPSLNVQIPIVGVPQADGEWDVSWLGNQAGWLDGTTFPTWAGNSVLTGHVYDANGKPGPFVQLKELTWGDKVIIHAWGAQYVYEVQEVTIVAKGATSSVIKHEELPWVTLITCSGYDEASNSYKYRVAVRAVMVEIK